MILVHSTPVTTEIAAIGTQVRTVPLEVGAISGIGRNVPRLTVAPKLAVVLPNILVVSTDIPTALLDIAPIVLYILVHRLETVTLG